MSLVLTHLSEVLLVAFLLPQQAPVPHAPASPTPVVSPETSLSPELQRLSFLVVEWTQTELYHATSRVGSGAGRGKAAWLLGNHFLYVLYATRGPWGYAEARGFLGWDEGGKSYRLDWYDDRGHRREYRGTSPREGELALAGSDPANPEKGEEHLVFRRRDDGKVLLTIEIQVPGHPVAPFMEAVLSPSAPNE